MMLPWTLTPRHLAVFVLPGDRKRLGAFHHPTPLADALMPGSLNASPGNPANLKFGKPHAKRLRLFHQAQPFSREPLASVGGVGGVPFRRETR
jgi:hypothetical protein